MTLIHYFQCAEYLDDSKSSSSEDSSESRYDCEDKSNNGVCQKFHSCTNDCDLIYDALCLDLSCKVLACTYVHDCKQTCDDKLIKAIENYNEIDISNLIHEKMNLRSRKKRKRKNKRMNVRKNRNIGMSGIKGNGNINGIAALNNPSAKQTIFKNNNNNNGYSYSYSYVDVNGGTTNNNNVGSTFDYDSIEIINNNNDIGFTDINRPAVISYDGKGSNNNFGDYVKQLNHGINNKYQGNVKLKNRGNNNPFGSTKIVTSFINNNNNDNNYNRFHGFSGYNNNNRYISGNTKLNYKSNQMINGRQVITITNTNNNNGYGRQINNGKVRVINNNNNRGVSGTFTNNNNYKLMNIKKNKNYNKGHGSTITITTNNNNNYGKGRTITNNNNRLNGRIINNNSNMGSNRIIIHDNNIDTGVYLNNDNNVPAGYSIVNNNEVQDRRVRKSKRGRKSKGTRKPRKRKHRMNLFKINEINTTNIEPFNTNNVFKSSSQADDDGTVNDGLNDAHLNFIENSNITNKVRRSLTKNNFNLIDGTKINNNNASPQKVYKESNNMEKNNNFGATEVNHRLSNRSFQRNNNRNLQNFQNGKKITNNEGNSNFNLNRRNFIATASNDVYYDNDALSQLRRKSDKIDLKSIFNLSLIRRKRCTRKTGSSECTYNDNDDNYDDYNTDKTKLSATMLAGPKRIDDSKFVQTKKNKLLNLYQNSLLKVRRLNNGNYGI